LRHWDHDGVTLLIDFEEFVVPFFYGAIGAWIYLYRTLSKSYMNRSLNPSQASTKLVAHVYGGLVGWNSCSLCTSRMQAMDTEASMKLAQDDFATSAAIGFWPVTV